jgi:hypothetical protein
MLSESRGQSQEKECCVQSLTFEAVALEAVALGRLTSPAGAWGLPTLLVAGGALSLSFFGEV